MSNNLSENEINEHQHHSQKVTDFLQRYRFIYKIAQATQVDIDRLTAPKFSVMDYMWPDEVQLSNIIKDLLDPNGSHGQGELFLRLFLNRVNQELKLQKCEPLKLEQLGQTSAALEVTTTRITNCQRRIDIVLANPLWVIGLENKPWTYEQADQLKDYLEHLEKAHKIRPCHMIYLPGRCSKPESDDGSGKTVVIGYNWSDEKCGFGNKHAHLSDWLEESIGVCQVDKLRHFLIDFKNYIQKNFNDHDDNTGHRREQS